MHRIGPATPKTRIVLLTPRNHSASCQLCDKIGVGVDSGSSVRLKARPRSLPHVGALGAGIAGLFVERIGSGRLLQSYRTARLRALLRHSYDTVPFYRERFQSAGFHPDQFRTLDDLQRVPITRKADLRMTAEGDALAEDYNPARLIRYGTGGTTGMPTEVRFTRFEDRLLKAMRTQVMMGFGLRLRDRRASVVFCRAAAGTTWYKRLGMLRNQRIHVNLPWDQVLLKLRGCMPDVIRGYPSGLSALVDKLTDEDRNHIRPRFVTTDSENLTTLARTRIEKAFRAPVFDIYDCYECNVIAYQCPRGGQYHVMDSSVIVEVLNSGRRALPGESGEVALTSLHTWAAPLIRYMPGDLVEQGAANCSCGAPNSCLAKIHGRAQERFVLPDGRAIHPNLLATWLYPLCPRLRRYQIVQEALDQVVVRLQPVGGVSLPVETLEAARRGMARDLGQGVILRVDVVDDIPSEPNGKFRPYRCDLDAGAQWRAEAAANGVAQS
jgi:phenylacetate-CoA ligase